MLTSRDDGRYTFRAAMGHPQDVRQETLEVAGESLVVATLDIGNPQCVALMDRRCPIGRAFERLGPGLATHPRFPAGTNVEFAVVEAPDRVRILIWERGVGPTEASGTGACAAAITAMTFGGAARGVDVRSPGGTQRVEWTADGVFLTGWAEILFDATWRALTGAGGPARRRVSARLAGPAGRRNSCAACGYSAGVARPWSAAGAGVERSRSASAAASASRCGASAAIDGESPLATAARAAARAASARSTACSRLPAHRGWHAPRFGGGRDGSGLARPPTPPRRWPVRRPAAPAPAPRRRRGRRLRARAAVERVAQRGAVVAFGRRPGARGPAYRSRRVNSSAAYSAAPAARAASMAPWACDSSLVGGSAHATAAQRGTARPARRARRDDGIAREYTGRDRRDGCRSRR